MDTPIGKGGKVDDTSVVVAEIVEWTDAHREIWSQVRRNRKWKSILSCGGLQCGGCGAAPAGYTLCYSSSFPRLLGPPISEHCSLGSAPAEAPGCVRLLFSH